MWRRKEVEEWVVLHRLHDCSFSSSAFVLLNFLDDFDRHVFAFLPVNRAANDTSHKSATANKTDITNCMIRNVYLIALLRKLAHLRHVRNSCIWKKLLPISLFNLMFNWSFLQAGHRYLLFLHHFPSVVTWRRQQ